MSYRFRKPEPIPTLFVIVMTAIMFKLGFWQMDRLAWKNDLVATIEKAQSDSPQDLARLDLDRLTQMEWHNVILAGHFLYDKELYATPRYLKEQMGYGILTPMVLELQGKKRYVLVNRGWVPTQKKEPSARARGNSPDMLRVEGIIRSNLDRGWIWKHIFKNLPDKNVWVWYDLPAMEKKVGLPLLPIMIDATRVTNLDGTAIAEAPAPFPLEINIRNDHLGYAITWFLIGITFIVMFVVYYTEKKPKA